MEGPQRSSLLFLAYNIGLPPCLSASEFRTSQNNGVPLGGFLLLLLFVCFYARAGFLEIHRILECCRVLEFNIALCDQQVRSVKAPIGPHVVSASKLHGYELAVF